MPAEYASHQTATSANESFSFLLKAIRSAQAPPAMRRMEGVQMEYERTYSSLRCLVSVPPGSPPPAGWPVLVFLHGSGEAAPMDLHAAMTAHGPLRASSGDQATRRFIVVAPQLPAPGGNVWQAQARAVEAIAEAVAREFGGDRTRFYLTGFSLGGNGVLSIGSRRSDFWAALWPVDPTQPPPPAINLPMWVSAGERSRGNKAALSNPTGGPMRPERVYEDAGLDHVPTATNAYRTNGIYEWLLNHRVRGRGPQSPSASA